MEKGLKGLKTVTVTPEITAKAMNSGALEVFATPAMIALMENTACESISEYLEDGTGTVGTLVNVRHLSATPVGMTVTCETELTEADGRRLVFSVKAYDDAGLIGEGIHERFIINNEKFLTKANMKKTLQKA